MIELPKGKVCRNLPEQVAENMRNIEELYQKFKDSGLAPFIINLDSTTGTLSVEQFLIAENNLAIIVYNGVNYYKSGMSGDETKFIFRSLRYYAEEIDDDIDYYQVKNDIFEITRATRDFNLTNVSVGNFYLKEELDSSFAKLSGATFSGPVKAQTLEQTEANYSADISSFPNLSGGTPTATFCRVNQINGELHIVMMGNIENTTESAITGYSTTDIAVNLPSNLAQKIFDCKGVAVSANGNNTRIACVPANVFNNTTGQDMSKFVSGIIMIVFNTETANQIKIRFSKASQMSIASGVKHYFEARISFDLL